jgi:Flp pilus assembly protein TadD
MPSRLQQIQDMLADEPDDPELQYMLAMEHASLGDDAEAVRCFEALVSGHPEYPAAYHQGARALGRLGRMTEARRLLQRGIPIAMKKGETHAVGEMQELLETLED